MSTSLQNNHNPVVLKEPDFWRSILSVSGMTYRTTPLISPVYVVSNAVLFVMISPGFYVLISFYYVVFLSSVIMFFFFLGQLLVQCNYCLVVLPTLSLVVYYSHFGKINDDDDDEIRQPAAAGAAPGSQHSSSPHLLT